MNLHFRRMYAILKQNYKRRFFGDWASNLPRIFNSINKASKGIRFKRPSATNGSTVGTIWTVLFIRHCLQNRSWGFESFYPCQKKDWLFWSVFLFLFRKDSNPERAKSVKKVASGKFFSFLVRRRVPKCGAFGSSSRQSPSTPANIFGSNTGFEPFFIAKFESGNLHFFEHQFRL